MVREYQPKGYNNWTELYLAKHRQSFKEQLKIGALILAFFLAYCVVGYVEVGL